MPIVGMPNGDQVQFPDDWSKEQISAKIKEKFPDADKTDRFGPGYVPRGGYVGQSLKGAAQSYTGLADLALTAGDAMNAATGGASIPPPFGLPSTLASIIPSDFRKSMREFANEPYTPGYETAGRIGYWGAPLIGPAKGVQAGATALKESPEAMQIAKGLGSDAAIGLGAEALEKVILGHLPMGLSGIAAIALRHGIKKGLQMFGKGATKEGGEEAASAAGHAAERGRLGTAKPQSVGAEATAPKYKSMEEWRKDWGPGGPKQTELEKRLPKAPETPPTAKPRVRVPAQTRPAPEKYNFGKYGENGSE